MPMLIAAQIEIAIGDTLLRLQGWTLGAAAVGIGFALRYILREPMRRWTLGIALAVVGPPTLTKSAILKSASLSSFAKLP